jgi:hypothetical protein
MLLLMCCCRLHADSKVSAAVLRILLLYLQAVAAVHLLPQLRSKPDSVPLLLWLLLLLLLICCLHVFVAAPCRLALLQLTSLLEINPVTV